jgi:hypothetical protein
LPFIALALALMFSATTVITQTICDTNCTVAVREPFTVVTDANSAASVFGLAMNGAWVTVPLAVVNGMVEFYFASGLSVASAYTFIASEWATNGALVASTDPNTLTVTAPVDTVPPLVSLNVRHAGGSSIYKPTAVATDETALSRIELSLDGVRLVTCWVSPCAASMQIKRAGWHVVAATAWDTAGNQASDTWTVTG